MHYEQGYAYPLLVWLHGPQGNDNQLRQVMPLVSTRNHIGVAPCGTLGKPKDSQSFSWSQTPPHIGRAEERVFACIDSASEKFNIHPKRVFIAGYGCGGTMAIRIAWNHPEHFAGAASLSGPIPGNERPLKNLNRIGTTPFMIGQEGANFGSQSPVLEQIIWCGRRLNPERMLEKLSASLVLRSS